MHAKAHTRFQYGLMCGEWTDTGAKVTNISRGFGLSPPGGSFEPKTSFRRALSLPLGQGSRWIFGLSTAFKELDE